MSKNKLTKQISLKLFQLIGLIVIVSALCISGTMLLMDGQSLSNTSRLTQSSHLPPRLVNGLSKSYSLLKNIYIGDIDEEKLIDGALAGFIGGANDQYTSYLNKEERESLNQVTDASFEGVGVEIEPAGDFIRVVSPILNSPAHKGGLQTDDLIIAVNGESTKGFSLSELSKKVRGPKGTTVNLTIRRGNSEFDITLTRDKIPVITVHSEIDASDKTIGIIKISSFAKSTYDEMVSAIKQLRESGATKFVLDVRNNPGGLLDVVAKMVNVFVENDQIIYQMEDRESGKVPFKSSSQLGTFKVTEPIVVLINKGSASASEIFAAALKELKRAQIVGVTSFGKGTAQTILDLDDETGLKITYSKWLTPEGNWVHEKGLEPNISVALPEYASYALINVQQLPKMGDSNDMILNLQKTLQALGHSIALTGQYDEQTKQVIANYQQINQLSGNGVMTEETANHINQALSTKIKQNDTQLEQAKSQLK